MKITIHDQLANHRRGRFLLSILNAEILEDGFPDAGIFLMTGKDYQEFSDSEKEKYWKWCGKSGRTLLLMPPFEQNSINDYVDWNIEYISNPLDKNNYPISDQVAMEVSSHIVGQDGEFDRDSGHQWNDYSINTRYYKQHSATGVFSVTCLPLWSIALMEEGAGIFDWLSELHSHAGKAQAKSLEPADVQSINELKPIDYSVLVCVYAFSNSNADELLKIMDSQEISIIQINHNEIKNIISLLEKSALIEKQGLTEVGEELLRSSPYWGYAQSMREVVA